MLLALARGDDPVSAARLGAAAASIVVEGRGGETLARVGEAWERVARVPVVPEERPTSAPPSTRSSAVEPVVAIRGVSKRYGGLTALGGVDLDIEPGEIFALLGPNGAGKTTLISIVAASSARPRATRACSATTSSATTAHPAGASGWCRRRSTSTRSSRSRRRLRFQVGYFGVRLDEARLDEILDALDLAREAEDQHPRALGRHEAAPAHRQGAGARAAGGVPRRADRRRRRRAAPRPVGYVRKLRDARHHHRAHHALPRGGGGARRPGRRHRPRPAGRRRGEARAAGAATAARTLRARPRARRSPRLPPALAGARRRARRGRAWPSRSRSRAGRVLRARRSPRPPRRGSPSRDVETRRPRSRTCSCSSRRRPKRRRAVMTLGLPHAASPRRRAAS